jgi:hypothetical protein
VPHQELHHHTSVMGTTNNPPIPLKPEADKTMMEEPLKLEVVGTPEWRTA